MLCYFTFDYFIQLLYLKPLDLPKKTWKAVYFNFFFFCSIDFIFAVACS